MIEVWYRIVDFINDPATSAAAVEIMAARVGLAPDEYAQFMKGTRFLAKAEAMARYRATEDLGSLGGSTMVADSFNIKYKVYSTPQTVDDYISDVLYR